jgi:hypothetical protein
MLKQAIQRGRRRSKNRRRTLLGYVEDSVEPRTKLGACFSIRLELVLRHAIPQCIAGELEEPACFGNIPACALQCFL